MTELEVVWLTICGTVLAIAGGIALFNTLDKCGVFALKATAKRIEAEKLKDANKKLLEGKYI